MADVQCDRCRKVFFWSAFDRGALPRRGDIYCAPCGRDMHAESALWRQRLAERKAAREAAKAAEAAKARKP